VIKELNSLGLVLIPIEISSLDRALAVHGLENVTARIASTLVFVSRDLFISTATFQIGALISFWLVLLYIVV
jgi:hypothetical protein